MKVYEIFKSISGEIARFPQGSICAFVRFSGCNLVCPFCDATHTQSGSIYSEETPAGIIEILRPFKTKNIIITGGEPLIQKQNEFEYFLFRLLEEDYNISVETNGSILIPYISSFISWIIDYKMDAPERMIWKNFIKAGPKDFIKFVVKDRKEIQEAIKLQKQMIKEGSKAIFAYSPVIYTFSEEVKEASHIIYQELVNQEMQAVINIQMHKFLKFD